MIKESEKEVGYYDEYYILSFNLPGLSGAKALSNNVKPILTTIDKSQISGQV